MMHYTEKCLHLDLFDYRISMKLHAENQGNQVNPTNQGSDKGGGKR